MLDETTCGDPPRSGGDSTKPVKAIFHLVSILALGTFTFAEVQIEPEAPRWGQEIIVRVTPEFPRDRLYPGDQVYVILETLHQGIALSVTEETDWNGQEFISRLSLPSHCEFVRVYVVTPENRVGTKRFVPRTEDGEMPPGAGVLGSCKMGDDVACKESIESELVEHPRLWWLYPEIWRIRMRSGDTATDEILSRLRLLEAEEKVPSLIRTLAIGYWYANQPDRAFEWLTQLCTRFPDSSYSVKALNEADYQIFSKNLDHLAPRLEALKVEVVNEAPTNPHLREEQNALGWILPSAGVSLAAVHRLFEAWVEENAADPHPYLLLANGLFKESTSYQEAERLLNRSLELFHQPRPIDQLRNYPRCIAFRLRSQLRLKRGAAADALADIKMAQEYALYQWTEDLEIEAEIWRSIGYFDQAEEILLKAYRKGSPVAEGLFKDTYIARTGDSRDFPDYFMRHLTGENTRKDSADKPELEPAPQIDGTTLDGIELTSESLRGQLVVANFWFTTCAPCIGEIPGLNQLADKFGGKVRFLAFATDPPERVKQFLQDHEFRYEIVPSSSRLAGAFGVEGYPRHYILDRDGYIVWKAQGANPKNIKLLEAVLERLLSGQLVPAGGRRN